MICVALILFLLLTLLAMYLYFLRLYKAQEHLLAEIRGQREATVHLMHRIGLNINSSLDLDGSLETIAEYIVEQTHAESGAIYLLDADGKTLQARVVTGLFPPMHRTTDYILTKQKFLSEKIKRDRIELGEGIIGFVAKTGESLLISDALADPRVPRTSTDFLQIQTMMVTPLRIRQKIVGVFAVVNKTRNEPFHDQDLRLLEQLAVQAALTVDIVRLYEHQAAQRRLEQELQLATEFQKMLLPRELPEVSDLDIGAITQPALEVGGDYYDIFWVEEQKLLALAIVDVSGKGIPGGLVAASLRSSLRAEAASGDCPREVLKRVNRHIFRDTKEGVFITVTYGLLDVEKRLFSFARAGHEPTLVWNRENPAPRVCAPSGIALGLVQDPMFDVLEECEVELKTGDVVVMYTDGVIEAANQDGEEYGLPRFQKILGTRLTHPSNALIEGVLEDIHQFTKGIPQQDDITLLVFRLL